MASPALAADERDPRAAEVKPAPSSARARGLAGDDDAGGQLDARRRRCQGRRNQRPTSTSPPKMTAARMAPRRAARMATSRRPVGSGRQSDPRAHRSAAKPVQDLRRVAIGREDGIEDMLDRGRPDDERVPLE